MDKTDISLLLKASDDITFIKNAYQKFLSRSIAFQDLAEHLRLLRKGMSRKAMLYCIVQSPEFGDRFAVPEVNVLRLAYFSYLVQKPVLSILRPAKKVTGFSPYHSRLASVRKNNFPACHSTELEYEVLSRCQISALSSLIAPYVNAEDIYYSGIIAKTILNENGNLSAKALPQTDPMNLYSPKIGTCLLTDPALVCNLLTQEDFSAFAGRLNDYFIFTMPVFPFPAGSISVIWGNEWKTLDGDASLKWFVDEQSHVPFVLYNNSNTIQKVTLKFSLISLGNCSEIIASFNGKDYKHYTFQSDIALEVEETFYLHPYYNRIMFSYIGSGVSSEEDDPVSVMFAVSSPTICQNTDTPLQRQSEYNLTSSLPAAADYQYILPDSAIRYLLHKSSFFEVAAWHISDDYQYQELPVTRFDHTSSEGNKKGYYTLKENSMPGPQSGVILYIAKRKAATVNIHSGKEVL